jgi:peptide/nickel transport system substrate-binding protein
MAALDMEPVMRAAFASEDFYRLQPGILYPEQEQWASDAGSPVYDQQDVEAATAMLAGSGYNGEELTWITTREYPYMYTNATVAEQQLEAIGFNITLEVVDYATIVDRRTRPAEFDIFSGATTFTADPGIWPCWNETWPGTWTDPQKDALVQQLNTTTDVAARQQVWAELQAYFYDQVPIVKFGDLFDLSAHAAGLEGMDPGPFPRYWGVSAGPEA